MKISHERTINDFKNKVRNLYCNGGQCYELYADISKEYIQNFVNASLAYMQELKNSMATDKTLFSQLFKTYQNNSFSAMETCVDALFYAKINNSFDFCQSGVYDVYSNP